MKELLKSSNWFAGLQWLFFIFTNIVVIPITIGAAFQLDSGKTVMLLQLSFIVTGLACILQVVMGHGRAIMEGQSGLWWGVILILCSTASAQGIPLATLGGSLAVGIILSGIITIFIGLTGVGQRLARMFNDGVMGVFMLLFGCQLIAIFFRGMLGIPFGNESSSAPMDLSIALFSVIVAVVVMVITVKARPSISRYALLIGIILGWVTFSLLYPPQEVVSAQTSFQFDLFPLGAPAWNLGIIVTAMLTGLLNTANTFGALKGTDEMYRSKATARQYRSTFTISGLFVMISGVFGLVPYAPYVSSIGFLSQTRILNRLPLVLGGLMFMTMGIIPAVGHFFSRLPLSVGSAVLFVAYLQLFKSSMQYFGRIKFNTANIYRSAIPVFAGIVIMTMPVSYFESIPTVVRPFLSSGLLVGIVLALLLENGWSWDRIGEQSEINRDVKNEKG